MGEASDQWLAALEGAVLAGRYKLERVIGQGGMGVVFEATHLTVGRRVAIKLLDPGLAGDAVAAQRFHQEARAAAAVGRRGVVDVLDFDLDARAGPFLVMEFLVGESLQDRLRRVGALGVGEATRAMLALLETLAAVHARGIVHRDLKPGNLFLSLQDDGSEVLKVLDFGISRVADPHADATPLTSPGSRLGTPRYMSPEQAASPSDVDARTDLYAAGVILYAMLTGIPPAPAVARGPGLDAPHSSTLPPLSDLAPHVPAALAAVVERATARARASRFGSADEMAQALRTALREVGAGASTGALGPRVSAPAVVRAPTASTAAMHGDTRAGPLESGTTADTLAERPAADARPATSKRYGPLVAVLVFASALTLAGGIAIVRTPPQRAASPAPTPVASTPSRSVAGTGAPDAGRAGPSSQTPGVAPGSAGAEVTRMPAGDAGAPSRRPGGLLGFFLGNGHITLHSGPLVRPSDAGPAPLDDATPPPDTEHAAADRAALARSATLAADGHRAEALEIQRQICAEPSAAMAPRSADARVVAEACLARARTERAELDALPVGETPEALRAAYAAWERRFADTSAALATAVRLGTREVGLCAAREGAEANEDFADRHERLPAQGATPELTAVLAALRARAERYRLAALGGYAGVAEHEPRGAPCALGAGAARARLALRIPDAGAAPPR